MSEELINGFPLSAQQRRIWLAQQEGSVPPAQCAILLEGPLDVPALQGALLAVIARHDILRTSFREIKGLAFPVQLVHPSADLTFKQIECKESDLDDVWAAEGLSFALEPSVVRGCLTRMDNSQHALIITISPLCGDLRTLENLFAELVAEYAAASEAVQNAEPATLQYLQFSAWQDSLLDRDDAQDGLEFWRQRVAEASQDAPRFPFEPIGIASQHPQAESCRLELRAEIAQKIRTLAREHSVAEEAVLFTAWQELARRWTGTCATMWAAISGRTHELLAGAFGPIGTLVPVTSQSPQSRDFLSDLMRASDALCSADEWSMFYRPDQDLALACRAAAFSFEYSELPDCRHTANLKFSLARSLHIAEKVDAGLVCIARPESISLELHYNAGRIDRAYARAMLEALSSFIEHVDPYQTTSHIDISSKVPDALPSVEKTAPMPDNGLLHRLFEEQVARTPDRIAVVHGREQLTFAQLNERANRLANYLIGLGATPECPVAVCLERSCDTIVAILGILKTGAAYVPVDPSYPVQRIRYIFHQTNVSVVLAHSRLLSALPRSEANVVCLDTDDMLQRSAASNPAAPSTPDNLAYIIYTSGSTGNPKGVMVSHRSAANLLNALRQRVYASVPAPSRIAMNAPAVFDASVKQWIQLLDGNTLCIVPEHVRLNPDDLAAFLTDQDVEVLDCTPSQLRLLLACSAFRETAALGYVLVGGEDIDAQLWSRMVSDVRRAYFNVYGPTECTVDATAVRIDGSQQPAIGHPLLNTSVHVLDSILTEQPVGFAGELYIGGAGVARGYRNRPDLTADRFLPDPFSATPGARMYRTGDLVCKLADAALKFVGRADGQVKLRGHRIELGEIESVLKQADTVRDALVIVRGEQEGQQKLVAYVVPQVGTVVVGNELRLHLRRHLPDYMLPSAFVTLPAFPLTTNGKVDVRALPEPREEQDRVLQSHTAPANQSERVIAKIWQDVLGVTKLGVHDNFFDLGGHSLLMVQVYTRLRAAFDKEISMVELFRNPTIALLSHYFSGTVSQTAAPAKAADRAARRIAAVAQGPLHAVRRAE